MLYEKAMELRAEGEFKDRRQERGSSMTINREHEHVQRQGQAGQPQDGGDNGGRPVPDADQQAAGGGDGGAADTAGAAAMEGPMEPCALGKDKLKRSKRWTNWHREAENKMRYMGITKNIQRMNFLRRCAGAKLTKIWESAWCSRRTGRGRWQCLPTPMNRWWRA